MKHVRTWWPFTLLVFAWSINRIIWSPQLTYIKYAHNNLTMVGLQLLHGGTIILFLVALLTMGAVLGRQPLRLARTVKLWLYTILVTCGAVVVDWLAFNQFNYHRLYNALLPVTRNVAPLATAVIIASALLPWLRSKLTGRGNLTGIVLAMLPLAATSVFNRDMFGLLGGTSVTFALLVLTVGALADQLTINRRTVVSGWARPWWGYPADRDHARCRLPDPRQLAHGRAVHHTGLLARCRRGSRRFLAIEEAGDPLCRNRQVPGLLSDRVSNPVQRYHYPQPGGYPDQDHE